MTILARSLTFEPTDPAPGMTAVPEVISLPGMLALPPVSFFNASQGQRDTLPQMTGMTVANLDSAFLETWMFNSWGKHALFSATPVSGDSLIFNPLTAMFDPTPVNRPLLSQLRVYNDATDSVEVKRVYMSNALTNTSGLTTATMTPAGEHTLTGVTNKTYRVTVDSAGTLDWTDATFKWSNDGGTTWQATGVPVATGSTAGRKVLAPLALDNGVSIMFAEGNLSSGDYWTFTAIASGNQLYDLKVDTTNSGLLVGKYLYLSDGLGGTDFGFWSDGAGQARWWFLQGLPGFGGDYFLYDTTNRAFFLYAQDSIPASRIYLGLTGYAARTTPATPAAGYGLIYSKTVGTPRPHWLDSGGVESIIPQAAKAETISGAWTFEAASTITTSSFIKLGVIATPATPAATFASFYQKANKPYWLDSGGVESIIPQAAKAETITGAWTFSTAIVSATITTLTATTLTAPTFRATNITQPGAPYTTRITVADNSPHVTVTGNLNTIGAIGATGSVWGASITAQVDAVERISFAATTPHVSLADDVKVTGALEAVTSLTTPVIYGGVGAGSDLTLRSTSNATKGNLFFGTSSTYDEVNNRLGIGTTTPGSANAYAKMELYGTSGNAAGPHFKTTATVDAYPLLHALSWTHDNIALGFDHYFDGAWRSASNTTNFSLYKVSGVLNIMYANAVAAGSAQTMVKAITINADGNIGLGTTQSFGGGKGVVNLFNAPTVPTTNPTGGGILYAEGGALKWRGSSGTTTTLGVA